ncbi:hypothetical protein [Synechococcus sp. ROS8604]|uniref:hypothetical protein n=1 Tax=Synechococcus sp. ROS8604 TaxID=1442557 RepID=UPI001CA3CD31|nr:hypothetical protein [Synechococcus sp. ROS8604]
MFPTGAMAGSLNNDFGASSSEFTGTSTGSSVIKVQSDITIDNVVNIASETSTTSLDLDANNGRFMTRAPGAAAYNQSSGMAAGAIEFEGEGNFVFTDTESSQEGFAAEGSADVTVEGEASGAATGAGALSPFAGILAGSGSVEASGSVEGEADVAVVESTSSSTVDTNQGSVSGDATGGGSFSTQGTGWAGLQSEIAVDGQISGSVQSGTTTIGGTIKETGLTSTTVDLTSITTGTSFGSKASSFRNSSF